MLERSLEKCLMKASFIIAALFQVAGLAGEDNFSQDLPEVARIGFVINSNLETLSTEASKNLQSFINEYGEKSKRTSLTTDEVAFPFLTMYVCDSELNLDSLYSIRGMRSGGVAIMRVARENIEPRKKGGWKLRSWQPDRLTFIPEKNAAEFLKLLREGSARIDEQLTADKEVLSPRNKD